MKNSEEERKRLEQLFLNELTEAKAAPLGEKKLDVSIRSTDAEQFYL